MADSYSVKAILSASDKGFTSTINKAFSSLKSAMSSITFGALTSMGSAAFGALSNGVSGLVNEINDSNAAWQVFESNLSIAEKNGIKLEKSISGIRDELQDYAQDTVYSASDMAQTYAQLAAVGVKDTAKLVKGFGGLAAAAEDPQQAMKTLSTQATQMAAKPTVAWADFKLMLEQSPAGMAAVAKHMGMTTAELVSAVQDGKVKTEDFFKTIATVGGDAEGEFYKMATTAKTVGQAMDGLKETLGNKLTPAFDVLSKIGIKAIDKISDAFAGINAQGLADKVSGWVKKAQPLWKSFSKAVSTTYKIISGVIKKISPAFNGLSKKVNSSLKSVLDAIGNLDVDKIVSKIGVVLEKAKPYWDSFKNTVIAIKNAVSAVLPYILGALKKIGDFFLNNSETISKCIPWIIGLVAAYKGFKIVNTIAPAVSSFAKSIASMASKGIAGLASKLFGISTAQKEVGKSSASSSKQMLASAKAFMMIGAGVLMIAGGFALLAFSAIKLSEAGWPAIAVMAGLVIAVAALGYGMMMMVNSMKGTPKKLQSIGLAFLAMGAAVLLISIGFAILAQSAIALAAAGWPAIAVMIGLVAVIALLAVGAAALGTALTDGALGFIAFGAAILLCGVGALLAALALQMIVAVLPAICQYGLQGAVAILALGAAMLVFGAGALVAGAGCIVLGAGLLVIAAALLVAGAAMLILGTGALLAATSLAIISMVLPVIATYGLQGALAFVALGGALIIFAAGATLAGVGALALGAGLLVTAAAVLLLAAGMLVLSAAVLVLAAGFAIIMTSVVVCATMFPMMAASALLAATAFLVLMGASALLAPIMLLLSVALIAMTAAVALGAIGVAAFGIAMIAASAGTIIMAGALLLVTAEMKSIAKEAKTAEKSLKAMRKSVSVVESGLKSIKNIAKSAMDKLLSAFDNTAGKVKSSGEKVGKGFCDGMKGGLLVAPMYAIASVAQVNAALKSGYSLAYNSGRFIGTGFANGMKSMLGEIKSAAAQMAAAADKAVRAKAKIGSPSKIADKLGGWWGEGYENGILGMVKKVQAAAAKLVSLPTIQTPELAYAFAGEMGAEYDYYRNADYVIEVPLTVDGKEFARATANYTQAELDRKQARESRKKGKV